MKKKNTLFLVCLVLTFFANVPDARAFQNIINCSDADCLETALANAQPGDEIVLAPGTYVGGMRSAADNYSSFASDASGTSNNPIILRGSSSSNKPVISDGRSSYSWYGLNITGNYWIIRDIKVEGVQKGIVFDNANHCDLINVEVSEIGQEAIHYRDGSSDGLIKGCIITDTGKEDDKFGEGIYLGSSKNAHGKFEKECKNITIENCTTGPNVSAEGIDVKEGTYNIIIRNCTFIAKGISGSVPGQKFEDALIDLKGARAFVYKNDFIRDGESELKAGIDFQERGTDNSGFQNAVFDNDFDFDGVASIPTMRSKGGNSTEIHFWNNRKNGSDSGHFPASDPDYQNTIDDLSFSCPSWNVEPCGALSVSEVKDIDFTILQSPGQKKITVLGVAGVNEISVFDIQGKLISSLSSSNAVIDLDLSNTSNGIYVITLAAGPKKSSKLISL